MMMGGKVISAEQLESDDFGSKRFVSLSHLVY